MYKILTIKKNKILTLNSTQHLTARKKVTKKKKRKFIFNLQTYQYIRTTMAFKQ